jgi:hypothetical protein
LRYFRNSFTSELCFRSHSWIQCFHKTSIVWVFVDCTRTIRRDGLRVAVVFEQWQRRVFAQTARIAAATRALGGCVTEITERYLVVLFSRFIKLPPSGQSTTVTENGRCISPDGTAERHHHLAVELAATKAELRKLRCELWVFVGLEVRSVRLMRTANLCRCAAYEFNKQVETKC